MNEVEKLVNKLLAEIPEFHEVYHEHLSFNGEVLPYVLFGELADFASKAYARKKFALVEQIIDFINDAVTSSSDEIRGLLQVSFLMHLPRLHGYIEMRAKLNEKTLTLLRNELRESLPESES